MCTQPSNRSYLKHLTDNLHLCWGAARAGDLRCLQCHSVQVWHPQSQDRRWRSSQPGGLWEQGVWLLVYKFWSLKTNGPHFLISRAAEGNRCQFLERSQFPFCICCLWPTHQTVPTHPKADLPHLIHSHTQSGSTLTRTPKWGFAKLAGIPLTNLIQHLS